VYRQTPLLIKVFLVGSIAATMSFPAQAQVLLAQSQSSAQVKELLQQGRNLVQAGDYNRAIAVYQQAAELEPKNASIYSGIGYLYALQGNYSTALNFYRRATALNPNNSDYQYALGYVSGNLGDNARAKEAYRRAIQLNRSNVNAYVGLATILLRLGDYKSAQWAYDEAVKLAPKNPQVFELRGTMLKKQGKAKEAIAIFRKARDLYEQQGKYDSVSRIEATLRELGV
jgi:Flp pilus assembly protein TadD